MHWWHQVRVRDPTTVAAPCLRSVCLRFRALHVVFVVWSPRRSCLSAVMHACPAFPSTSHDLLSTFMLSPLTSANLTQVHTANQPSMLLSWWFRPVNTEAPQFRRHTRAAEKAALADNLVTSDGSDKEDAAPPPAPPVSHPPVPLQRDFTAYLHSVFGACSSHSDACEDDDEPDRASSDCESDCDDEDSDTHIITPSHATGIQLGSLTRFLEPALERGPSDSSEVLSSSSGEKVGSQSKASSA